MAYNYRLTAYNYCLTAYNYSLTTYNYDLTSYNYGLESYNYNSVSYNYRLWSYNYHSMPYNYRSRSYFIPFPHFLGLWGQKWGPWQANLLKTADGVQRGASEAGCVPPFYDRQLSDAPLKIVQKRLASYPRPGRESGHYPVYTNRPS